VRVSVDSLRIVDGSSVAWLAFAQSQPEATTFHHPAWLGLLATTYRYRPLVLTQMDQRGRIVAGLPMLEVRSWLTGHRFISLPFTDYCPPLGLDDDRLAQFAASFMQWWERMGAPNVEVRGRLPDLPHIHRSSDAVRHILPLEPDTRRLERGLTPSWARAIRKARHEGIEVDLTRSVSALPAFYRLHWMTRQRQGIPVQPKRYFENLWTSIMQAGLGFVSLACKSGKPIAGAVFFSWNDQLIYKYGASDPGYLRARPNNLAIWAGIEWGCRNGCTRLDLGKTLLDHQGLRNFKLGVGSAEIPLEYSYMGKGPLQATSGAAMRTVSRVIRASPPIVGRTIGELLYRHFP
jgi:CelD/BcsL family acetyltransferase involved in cellulose biosynthesis